MQKIDAENFLSILFCEMNKTDLKIISDNLEEQITDSGLKIRISKQQLIMNKIILDDKDAIKITITIPVYVKKNFVEIYRQVLKISE